MSDVTAIGYLVASVLFVLGLKGLARPKTAVRGNALGALAMLVAVAVTLADQAIVSYTTILIGVVIGAAIGVALALRVKMTAMPELVALFNGFGGASSALVASASFLIATDGAATGDGAFGNAMTGATAAIGALTFTGSLIAFAKLGEWLGWSGFAGVRWFNISLMVIVVAAGVGLVAETGQTAWLIAILVVAAVLGVTGVVPIGGADMPVVIALLNSMSGLAAAGAGFVLDNTVLIVAGALVGASGLILTTIMCRAMNRTLPEVLFADAPATAGGSGNGDGIYTGRVRSTGADDVAMILDGAQRVAIIPGYGLAVAQAQHAVRDLTKTLNDRGVHVEFGIHPVAGRMPGHMNVLLAEAEIDYELLIEMDQINPTFAQTDVAIVLGANDVVNPVARTDPDSPIAGMPILDVDKARVVVVIKRSLSPGFAGIPNPLFVADNALMYFGDGKQAVVDITRALADL